jgi:hypothetical protein
MLKMLQTIGALLSLSVMTSAQINPQEVPRVEFFNSFSYALGSNGNAPGWLASLTINRSIKNDPYLGLVFEVSRHYRSPVIQTPAGPLKDTTGFRSALFGFQVYMFRKSRVSPFLRLLPLGVSEENVVVTQDGKSRFDPRVSHTAAVGGGFDMKINKRVALRAVQIDYMGFGSDRPSRTRISTGLVLRF